MQLLSIFFVSCIWSAYLLEEYVEEILWQNPRTHKIAGNFNIRRYPHDKGVSILHRTLAELASLIEDNVMKKDNIRTTHIYGNQTTFFHGFSARKAFGWLLSLLGFGGGDEEKQSNKGLPRWYRDLQSIVPRLIEDKGDDNIKALLAPIIHTIEERYYVKIVLILVRRRRVPKSDIRNKVDVLIDYYDMLEPPKSANETEAQKKKRLKEIEKLTKLRDILAKKRQERERLKKINVAAKKKAKKQAIKERKAEKVRLKLERIEDREKRREERRLKEEERKKEQARLKEERRKKAEEARLAALANKTSPKLREMLRQDFVVVYRNEDSGRTSVYDEAS